MRLKALLASALGGLTLGGCANIGNMRVATVSFVQPETAEEPAEKERKRCEEEASGLAYIFDMLMEGTAHADEQAEKRAERRETMCAELAQVGQPGSQQTAPGPPASP